MENLSVLIVDDNPEFHFDVGLKLRKFCTLTKALDIPEMQKKLQSGDHYDIVLLDLAFDETNEPIGLDLIPKIRKAQKNARIIVVTKFFNKNYLVKAAQLGAVDFIDKADIEPDTLIYKIRKAMDTPLPGDEGTEMDDDDEVVADGRPLIGQSVQIKELRVILKQIGQLPKTPVLITGQTGTGKEVAARYLHRNSPRKNKPFVGVNLSAIPENLLESALFGHMKGSFTDARQDHEGFFKEAEGGVLLLDEIGDISLNIQVKLLRVIEERVIRPVGSNKDIPVNVHLLTATHKNLATAVAEGSFRNDLYQRLKTLTIEIPALWERIDDLELLLQYYLRIQDKDLKVANFFTKDALQQLHTYNWPGNIRELAGTVEHSFAWRIIYKKEMADVSCLPKEIREFSASGSASPNIPVPVISGINTPASNPKDAIPEPTVFQSKKERDAFNELHSIEEAMKKYNKVKTDVAAELEYLGTDGLRNRIRTLYRQFSHLFEYFPLIRQEYSTIVS